MLFVAFSLADFNICSLCLIFVSLINMCLGVLLICALGLSCLGLPGVFGLGWLFPSPFWEGFYYYCLKCFLMPFLFVFFFWDTYDSNVGMFNIVPEVSEVVLI